MELPALTTPQVKALEALATLAFATNRQITRFAYTATSYTYVTQATRALVAGKYLGVTQRVFNPFEQIFFLADKGRKLLLSYGLDYVPSPPRNVMQSWLFQEHTLGINDVLLAVRGVEQSGLLSVNHLLPDRVLKRDPIAVGKKRFIPDLWLDASIPNHPTPRRCVLIEIDRGTEEEAKWREKIATIIAFTQGPMRSRFDTTSVTIATNVLATRKVKPGPRMEQLMAWTRKELTHERKEAWAPLFLFSTENAGRTIDSHYCFASVWLSLAEGNKQALMPR